MLTDFVLNINTSNDIRQSSKVCMFSDAA